MNDRIGQTVRSPLLHFLIIGAAIYGASVLLAPAAPQDSGDTIRVSAGHIQWMEDSWTQRWNRPPTPAERQGLIDAHVRETVLYREALAMGLDADDVIIRRRLAQKLEFLFADLADTTPPTDEELRAHFDEHIEQYCEPEILTMTHVFIDPDRRGDRTLDDAADMLVQLQGAEDPTEAASELGDPFMLQRYYPQRSNAELSKLFGREFAASVFALPVGKWHGPVLSGYGTHLVYVHDRLQSPPPTFDLVRERVLVDVQDARRELINEECYQALLARYEIVVEEDADGEMVATR
jgi:hypothetical protein